MNSQGPSDLPKGEESASTTTAVGGAGSGHALTRWVMGVSAIVALLMILAVGAALWMGWRLNWPGRTSGPHSTIAERTPGRLRVLFIGNSFTEYNGGQALIVQQLAASAGRFPVIDEFTVFGATFKQLWDQTKARAVIGQGSWDYVVLQDHSQAALKWPSAMKTYARLFDAAVRKVDARPIFFMTWARRDQPFDQPIISRAYTNLAIKDDGILAPVGTAWQNAMRSRPDLVLYSRWDKKHPNGAGSYLTACVFYSVLFHESPHGLTGLIRQGTHTYINLNASDATFLQDIAWQTVSTAGPIAATQP